MMLKHDSRADDDFGRDRKLQLYGSSDMRVTVTKMFCWGRASELNRLNDWVASDEVGLTNVVTSRNDGLAGE